MLQAERFAAAAQILIAEIALDDPVFLHSRVDVEVSPDTAPDRDRPVSLSPSNDSIAFSVYLPRAGDPAPRANGSGVGEGDGQEDPGPEDGTLALASQVVYVLSVLSALPQDRFMALVENAFRRGLPHKISSGRPYAETADLFGEAHYAAVAALPPSQLGGDPPVATPADELATPRTPGPGYDRDAETGLVADRYSMLPPLLSQTLPLLFSDPPAAAVLTALAQEGWLDWQLLLAIHNRAVTLRALRAGLDVEGRTAESRQALAALARRPETPEAGPIPPELFTDGALRDHLRVAAVMTLRRHGLQSHTATPDFVGITALLRDRHGFASDDAPHPPLLPQP